MNGAHLTSQNVVTLLLGLELLRRFADDEMREARREENALKQAALQAMLDHIVELRDKLGSPSTDGTLA